MRETKCCACHEICTSRFTNAARDTKSANEPHVQKPRFTAPVTKSEVLDDHHHVQSAALATKAAFRSKTAPIPCKSTLEHKNTKFPLRLRQVLRACAVEARVDDVERHECTANSSELAVHGRALQRSKHQLLFTYCKNP